MKIDTQILRSRRSEIGEQMEQIHRDAGDRNLTRAEQGKWDRLRAEVRDLDAEIERVEAEQAHRDENIRRQIKWSGQDYVRKPGSVTAWDDLNPRTAAPDDYRRAAMSIIERADTITDTAREALAEAVEGRDPIAAQIITARANPHYDSAFAKIVSNPERAFFTMSPEELAAVHGVENARAAMATTTGTAGYLIPLSLDPNVVLSNAGAANPIRSLATVKQVSSSPHRAITSAGITGAWVAEATAIGDASPTFVGVDIPLYKMAVFVTGSYEILQDAARDLATVLPALLADSRDRLEADAFTVGSGSGAPKGVVTGLAAASAFVTATTRGSFTSASSADTLALLDAQSPRTRQSKKTAWVMNNAIRTVVRQQTVGTAGSLLMDLADDGRLLGYPLFEASGMAAVTTSGTYLAVLADFAQYVICDHVAGPSLEFIPNVVNGDGVPTGQRSWVFHHRVGADLLATSAGKILKS